MFFRKKAFPPDAAPLPTPGQLFEEAQTTLREAELADDTLALAWIEGQKTGRSTWDCLPVLPTVLTSATPFRNTSNGAADADVAERTKGRFADLLTAVERAWEREDLPALIDASLGYFRAFCIWRETASEEVSDQNAQDDEEDFLRNEALLDRIVPFLLAHKEAETAETIARLYHRTGLYYNTAQMVAAFAEAGSRETALALAREIPLDEKNAEFHVEALLEVAGACFRHAQHAQGRELIDEVLALNDAVRPDYRNGYPLCLVWAMETLCRSGLTEDAEALYRERRAEIPEPDALSLLIDAYRKQEHLEKAWDLLDRIADPLGRLHLGLPLAEAFHRRRGPDAAAPLYRELLEFLREHLKNDPKTRSYALCVLAVSLRDGTTLPESETPSD